MNEYKIQKTSLDNIAVAINNKLGTSGKINPLDMPAAINSIPEGGGFYVGDEAPENTDILWIDTDDDTDDGGGVDLIISAVWVGSLAPDNVLGWDYEIVSGDVSNVMNKIKANTTYMPKIILRRIDEYIEGRKDIRRIMTDCMLITDENDPTATALEFWIEEDTVFNPDVSFRNPPKILSVFLYSDGTFSGTWTGNPYE